MKVWYEGSRLVEANSVEEFIDAEPIWDSGARWKWQVADQYLDLLIDRTPSPFPYPKERPPSRGCVPLSRVESRVKVRPSCPRSVVPLGPPAPADGADRFAADRFALVSATTGARVLESTSLGTVAEFMSTSPDTFHVLAVGTNYDGSDAPAPPHVLDWVHNTAQWLRARQRRSVTA